MTPIERAAKIVGSRRQLAQELGVSLGRISQWRTDRIVADYCPIIERLTDGAVRCEDLRPDVDWAYLRATNCPGRADPQPTDSPAA